MRLHEHFDWLSRLLFHSLYILALLNLHLGQHGNKPLQ